MGSGETNVPVQVELGRDAPARARAVVARRQTELTHAADTYLCASLFFSALYCRIAEMGSVPALSEVVPRRRAGKMYQMGAPSFVI